MGTPKTVDICLCCDGNAADGLVATLVSAAHHLRSDSRMRVHLVDLGLGQELADQLRHIVASRLPRVTLEIIAFDATQLDRFPAPLGNTHVPRATYARFLLPELLPNVDRVIYLDCDLLVHHDLADLYELSIGSNPLGAVLDSTVKTLGGEIETLC